MTLPEAPEIAVVGAGAVGVAIATSLLHGRVTKRLGLYDLSAGKAEGEAMDLAHGAPFFGDAHVSGGSLEGFAAGKLCILAAGAKQRPGESRSDLLSRNVVSLSRIVERFEANGFPKIVLVVTNPVDVMTEALRRRLTRHGVHVFGSGTLLDTMRLRFALSRRLDLSPESIHAHVVGEHGDTSVCLLHAATAGGLPLSEAFARKNLTFDETTREALAAEVRGAAYEIIRRKGATSHAIGVAVARLAQAVMGDERVVLPVTGPVEAALSAGVPCVVGAEGAVMLGYPPLSESERVALDRSLAAIRESVARLEV